MEKRIQDRSRQGISSNHEEKLTLHPTYPIPPRTTPPPGHRLPSWPEKLCPDIIPP